MTYTKKAFYGFVWVSLGVVLSSLFGYLLRLLLARSLTLEEYGLIYAVLALFGMVGIFNHLGLYEALTRYISKYTVKNQKNKIKDVIVWSWKILHASSFIAAIAAFLLAEWLARAYFKSDVAASLIRIFALAVLLMPMHTILLGVFTGLQRMDLLTLYKSLYSIVLFFLTWALLEFGFGVLAPMMAHPLLWVFLYVLFFYIITCRVFPKFFRYRTHRGFDVPVTLLKFGVPVMFTTVAALVLAHIDTLLITFFSTLAEVGLYQVALPTAAILLFVSNIISTVFMPMVSELWEKKKRVLLGTALEDLQVYAYLLVLPPAVAVIAYPEFVLNLLFGSTYISAGQILRVLVLTNVILTMMSINVTALTGIGLPKNAAKIVATGAVFNVLSNLVLIPKYGAFGAALSTLVSAIIMFVLSMWFLTKKIQMRAPLARWLQATISGMVFLGFLWLSRTMFSGMNMYVKVGLAIMVGTLLYVAALFVTRTITLDEVQTLKRRVLSSR